MAGIVEDTLTAYLDKLAKVFEENKPELARKFTKGVVGEYQNPESGFIAPLMSTTFNPYLYTSAQMVNKWVIDQEEFITTVEVLYSGLGLHSIFPAGRARVWWEFATKDTWGKKDPFKRELARDYSYFQETGIDKLAKSDDAKHQGAIQTGLSQVNETALVEVEEYLNYLIDNP